MRGRLTISLDAIQDNYRFLVQKVAPSRCAVVVKADAYGLGVVHIAPALAALGAQDFFVALPEEGVTLRGILPDARIYILNGFLPGEAKHLAAHDLIPVLNDARALGEWAQTCLPAVVHVDTGLNRLGFNHAEFSSRVGEMQRMDIRYVMSHLACADRPDHPMNAVQLGRFGDACALLPGVKSSLAASDGIFCGADFHRDMVRPGAALYGLNPTPENANPMRRVVQLSVPVLQSRVVETDGTVGYAASQKVTRGQRLTTVALGYADGFSRALSNRGQLFWHGCSLPILGRVSMDVVVVDASAVPTPPGPGDMLEVFGPDYGPDQLGQAMGTIGYEMLTSLGHRFERQYVS